MHAAHAEMLGPCRVLKLAILFGLVCVTADRLEAQGPPFTVTLSNNGRICQSETEEGVPFDLGEGRLTVTTTPHEIVYVTVLTPKLVLIAGSPAMHGGSPDNKVHDFAIANTSDPGIAVFDLLAVRGKYGVAEIDVRVGDRKNTPQKQTFQVILLSPLVQYSQLTFNRSTSGSLATAKASTSPRRLGGSSSPPTTSVRARAMPRIPGQNAFAHADVRFDATVVVNDNPPGLLGAAGPTVSMSLTDSTHYTLSSEQTAVAFRGNAFCSREKVPAVGASVSPLPGVSTGTDLSRSVFSPDGYEVAGSDDNVVVDSTLALRQTYGIGVKYVVESVGSVDSGGSGESVAEIRAGPFRLQAVPICPF